MSVKSSLPHLLAICHRWLSEQLMPMPDTAAASSVSRGRTALASAIIFLLARGVGLLHWQDYHLQVGTDMSSLVTRYQTQAERLLAGENILFPHATSDRQPIQLLVHPPGYPIFLAAVYAAFGNHRERLVLAQILCSAAAAALIFFLVVELLSRRVALITGLLAAFSPHLWHAALCLLPDALVALPTLLAALLLAKASRRPRLWMIIAAGVMLGWSCWLRSNGMLLVFFFAGATLALFGSKQRLRYALALVGTTALIIAAITLRNYIVFGHFVPLSLGAGVTMVEGIADYDSDDRFGMPHSDAETKWKDAEWHQRADYADGLWRPDGIERDQYRFKRGLEVIRREPGWFAGVMLRRAASMLRYNDALTQGWPTDTSQAAVIAREPPFGHEMAASVAPTTFWANTPGDLLATGQTLSAQATCAIAGDGQSLKVEGDDTRFEDQFASAPISVEANSDYVLRLPVTWLQGKMAIKVTSPDRGIALASAIIAAPEANSSSAQKDDDENVASTTEATSGHAELPTASIVKLPFATGEHNAVRIVVSNNGDGPRPASAIGRAELEAYGETPLRWTGVVRSPVRIIQRNIYTTSRLPWLIAAGLLMLALARRWRALTILMTVPLYYLLVQSAFHTEYRYILPIHYFLFAAATALVVICGVGAMAIRWAWRKAAWRQGREG
jgi:hypothetical protein